MLKHRYVSVVMQLRRSVLIMVALVFAFGVFGAAPNVSANSSYSSGSYNSCGYGKQCAAIAPKIMPNGLEVIINLSDGKVIPLEGFDVIITQLNTSGVAFESATISIDGKQVGVVTPDETGTARWTWDPSEYSGTAVSIVVKASDGTTATYNYTVQIAEAPLVPAAGSGDDAKSNSGGARVNLAVDSNAEDEGLRAVLGAILPEGLKQAFRSMPEATINSFPYFLFIVLILIAIVTLVQIYQELNAVRRIKAAIEQEKLMIEMKKNFLGLASHFLRTPLTLISGGADLLAAGAKTQLKDAVDQLAGHINEIITGAETPSTTSEPPSPNASAVRVGTWVAILVVACGMAIFNLLAYASGRDIPMLNLITQVASLVLIGLGLYFIDRRFTLQRNEREVQDNLLVLQRQLQDSQDMFMERAATQLRDDYEVINKLASTLPPSDFAKPLQEGLQRIYGIIMKCRTAQMLKGSTSDRLPVETSIENIFEYKDAELAEKITAKNIAITPPTDKSVHVKEPLLVQYVARSVIDNAVAYTPEGGSIMLGANGPTSNMLLLTVKDTGKGISEDRRQLLFQPLSKVEGFENFDHDGMGFSLYLDRLIMKYLGGTIDLQSQDGQGTTVNLQLPATA